MTFDRRAMHAMLLLALAGWAASGISADAELRGHGGPVRAIAVAPDGTSAVSGGFDSSVIRWSLDRDAALEVLRVHDGPVSAVALLLDGRIATAGEDGRIAVSTAGRDQPDRILEGHAAPIAALAASPDGALLASASWDHTVRLWPLAGGPARVLEGHQQNVNGVAFSSDGRTVVSAGYDLAVRIWPVAGGAARSTMLPTPLNSVAVAPDGEIVTGGGDGHVYFLAPDGAMRSDVAALTGPILAVAVSPDGALVAAAGVRGSVAIIARATRVLARTLVGPGLPVWAVAFLPDSRTLLAGGADRLIRRWNAATGDALDAVSDRAEDPLAAYAGDRGAEVFRACVACHTVAPDEGERAGPTLAGLFGRRIATLPGYRFSSALKMLDIVWTPETVAKLFEVGPATYTPGTKMPEQTIGSAEDRAALVRFLERATMR